MRHGVPGNPAAVKCDNGCPKEFGRLWSASVHCGFQPDLKHGDKVSLDLVLSIRSGAFCISAVIFLSIRALHFAIRDIHRHICLLHWNARPHSDGAMCIEPSIRSYHTSAAQASSTSASVLARFGSWINNPIKSSSFVISSWDNNSLHSARSRSWEY